MSGFEEIFQYKQDIAGKLITSENLVKALTFEEKNFLDDPFVVENAESLISSQIFPYHKKIDVQKERKSFITYSLGGFKPVKLKYKAGYLTFRIYIHDEWMLTDHGFLRSDFIISEIDKLFNESNGFGIGKMLLDGMDEIANVPAPYVGFWIAYKNVDFA